jgi:hypothetical protein
MEISGPPLGGELLNVRCAIARAGQGRCQPRQTTDIDDTPAPAPLEWKPTQTQVSPPDERSCGIIIDGARAVEDVAAGGFGSYRLYQRETSLAMRQVFMAGPDDEQVEAPTTFSYGGRAVTRNATSKTRAKNARFDARERHLSLVKKGGSLGGLDF